MPMKFISQLPAYFVHRPIRVSYKLGSTENAGPENERPMRDHLDQRATDMTGK